MRFSHLEYNLWSAYVIFIATFIFGSHQIVPNAYTVVPLLPRNLANSLNYQSPLREHFSFLRILLCSNLDQGLLF